MAEDTDLNDADIAWVKSRLELHEVEERVEGITNSETLWGGPRGEGIVHIVKRLEKVSGNLVVAVDALQEAEKGRQKREHDARFLAEKRRQFRIRLIGLVFTPAILLPFARTVYVTVQPWAAAHGLPLPPLPTGIAAPLHP